MRIKNATLLGLLSLTTTGCMNHYARFEVRPTADSACAAEFVEATALGLVRDVADCFDMHLTVSDEPAGDILFQAVTRCFACDQATLTLARASGTGLLQFVIFTRPGSPNKRTLELAVALSQEIERRLPGCKVVFKQETPLGDFMAP